MNRTEAQALVGTRVSAWTASNGTYAGELIEVVSSKGRPWRGKVRIEGVLSVATHFEIGRGVVRRGFRPGEEIEVGGSSISECASPGSTYDQALQAELQKVTAWLEREPEGRYAGTFQLQIAALQETQRREATRLETGVWPDRAAAAPAPRSSNQSGAVGAPQLAGS